MKLPEHQLRVYEVTRDVLEKLLELMELPARVNLSEAFTVVDESGDAESVGLNIEGEDLGLLIGRRGQTMLSLQHILRLIVSSQADVKMPIVLDVEGYKERRCEGLRNLAFRLADQVTARKAPFAMEPMTPFERRIIPLPRAFWSDALDDSPVPPGCRAS